MAVQTDGKVLVGSEFPNPIARLNADGTVESAATFDPGLGPNVRVFGIALQPDGKILLGGAFTAVNGQPRNRVARLHANGVVEDTTTFHSAATPGVKTVEIRDTVTSRMLRPARVFSACKSRTEPGSAAVCGPIFRSGTFHR